MEQATSNEKVQVVPGVEGPRRVTDDRVLTMSREGGGVGVKLRIDYDDDERRYVCISFEVHRTPDANEGRGFVTSEVLRKLAVSSLIATTLATSTDHGDAPDRFFSIFRQLPNVDNIEPWGWTAPDGLREEGPTDRTLQWVAHLYLYAMALAMNPAKEVEDRLKLSHSTAGRWIRLARQKGYLGPSEGPGRAAG